MRVFACVVLGAVAASFGALACSSAANALGVVPTTGITVRAQDLTVGAGCGTGPGQVYKYAAVLADPHYGRVYDCFADAAFVNLPGTSDGGPYSLEIFLYDKAAYDANADFIEAAAGASNAIAALSQVPSTWTTSCTATQTLNIQTVAQCLPRTAGGPGSMVIATDSFPLGDGGTLACNAGFSGVSAIVVDGSGSSDAGADAGVSNGVACPSPIPLGPFPAFSTASANVTLFQGLGIVGTTTCHASIVPSQTTTATCDPVNPP